MRLKPLCQRTKELYTPKGQLHASWLWIFQRAPHRVFRRKPYASTFLSAVRLTVPQWSRIVFTKIARDRKGLGNFSGALAADHLRTVLENQPRARLVVATGSSQFEVLEQLTKEKGIDWPRVDGFHLDEYLGLDRTHPASFCGYLATRFVDKVPIGSFHFLEGKSGCESVVAEASRLWSQAPIDLAMIGIGENGHLAFNDPPADFQTTAIYHVVMLDEACRQQQVGEGWFPHLNDCPCQAISMTIYAILQSRKIICSVPDDRKADAVALSVDGPITPTVPASILQKHLDVTLVLDDSSSAKMSAIAKMHTQRV